MPDTTDPQDFDGCRRACRRAGTHTLAWGECEHAPEPEPTVSLSRVYTAADGLSAIGFDTYTVAGLADLIEPALRTIKIRIGPNARGMLERGEEVRLSVGEYVSLALAAADAIVHRTEDPERALATPAATPGRCSDPIECSHEAALGQAQQEVRRLGLMVDEYGQGASALTDKLYRARDMHRETCPLARGGVSSPAFRCGMCEVLDAPAVLPPAADRAASYRHAAHTIESMQGYPRLILPEEIVAGLRLLATGAQPEPGSPAYTRRPAAGERGEQQPQQDDGAAPEEALDLSDGPVRCPLCPYPVTLHTPNGARAHFTTVHPEQRITGRGPGPWPLLVADGDEEQAEGGADQDGTLIDDYLRFLRGQGPEPDLTQLPPADREAIAGRFEIVRALADRDPELPPLDLDPVARRLGLHQPDAAPVAGQPPADTTGEGSRPRFVRVCVACPGCDHTLDGNGACANGCHVPPAAVAEPGKEK